jgi:hypothetical protein
METYLMKSFSQAYREGLRDCQKFFGPYSTAIPVVLVIWPFIALAAAPPSLPLLPILLLPAIGLGLIFAGHILKHMFEGSEPAEEMVGSRLYSSDSDDEGANEFSSSPQNASGHSYACAAAFSETLGLLDDDDDDGYVSPHDDETLGLLHAGTPTQPDPEHLGKLDAETLNKPGVRSLLGRGRGRAGFFPPNTTTTAADEEVTIPLNDFK